MKTFIILRDKIEAAYEQLFSRRSRVENESSLAPAQRGEHANWRKNDRVTGTIFPTRTLLPRYQY